MTDFGRRIRTSIGLALVATWALGCANGPNSSYEEFGDRINTRGFGHQYAQPEGQDELTLGPGDVVSIQIANLPDLSSQQPVRIDGVVTAPFVGDVKVAGLTDCQVEEKLTVLLSPYIRDVTVQVVTLQVVSKRIYLYTMGRFGELVGRMLPIQGDMTLIDLITYMGGVPQLADDCHIQVLRGDPRHPKRLDVNVRDMIMNGYTAANIRMKPDDIVFMPPNFFAAVSISLNKVLLPVRVISRSVQDAASSFFFVTQGGVRTRTFGTSGAGF